MHLQRIAANWPQNAFQWIRFAANNKRERNLCALRPCATSLSLFRDPIHIPRFLPRPLRKTETVLESGEDLHNLPIKYRGKA